MGPYSIRERALERRWSRILRRCGGKLSLEQVWANVVIRKKKLTLLRMEFRGGELRILRSGAEEFDRRNDIPESCYFERNRSDGT